MRRLYVEPVMFRAPAGFVAAAAAEARRKHMTMSEFLRRAVLDRLSTEGVTIPAASGPRTPTSRESGRS